MFKRALNFARKHMPMDFGFKAFAVFVTLFAVFVVTLWNMLLLNLALLLIDLPLKYWFGLKLQMNDGALDSIFIFLLLRNIYLGVKELRKDKSTEKSSEKGRKRLSLAA